MQHSLPNILPACAACLGATDSAQTDGMNAAILFLLGVVFVVLGVVISVGYTILMAERS